MRRVNHAIIAEKGRSDCLLAAWYDPTQPQSATVHRLETAVMEEVAGAFLMRQAIPKLLQYTVLDALINSDALREIRRG
jgi:hypothetical protein